ncbi:helix-turn-helix domain-containing protein [Bizionia arctica]|uniref:Helix-turn-helix domain-containing protein n=1 Tax=Bizionia arctica TaxID=1495645 RepID=A0A917LQ70_9FLAO|nr:helix-turn-helix domain-containing protein [Bizionia arctica]GGG50684.1 hypothetical protein GCM10010976_22380 [Bizionia arctica]
MKADNSVVLKRQKLNKDQYPFLINSADEEWLNVQELMVYFKMSRRSINRLVKTNKIPCTKLGGTLLFPKKLMNKIMLQRALMQMNTSSLDFDDSEL